MKKSYLLPCLWSLQIMAQGVAGTTAEQTSRGGLYWLIDHPFRWTWIFMLVSWYIAFQAIRRHGNYRVARAKWIRVGRDMDDFLWGLIREVLIYKLLFCLVVTGTYIGGVYIYAMYIYKK